ncbi:metalloendopeptidase [Paenibacillus montaniterrae]|uniref:Metalloendopeptidase n=1 Tax=Paenibacillus montaniterrae TaxID=429341 RepID=A0A919YSY6_9BACL|nr:M23 family metallopeptidase [Paenibacillus montaniterrae]GIP19140.1 metalloendopeptidase [Paenibacillus montaniterrae]
MNKKKITAYMLSAALFLSIAAVSPSSYASTLSQIEKQIQQKNEEKKKSEERAAQAQADKTEVEKEQIAVENEKKQLEAERDKLMAEIRELAKAMEKTEAEIREAEKQLKITEQELEEAIQQVEKQDELMQKRTRLMYSNGVVSYLDVLLSATSFSDFLDRFDSLQMILKSDREILDSFKEAQQVVEDKKAEVEEQLAALEAMYKELEEEEKVLMEKEAEKEELIEKLAQKSAELDELHTELSEITEEEERNLVKIASELSKLYAEKNRIANPYSGGKLGMPIDSKYRVTSNFGMRIHPISGKRKAHNGIDFGAPSGTPIYAAESGNVIVAKYTSGYGNTVIIDHGNGLWTLYGHIKKGGILVSEGDQVKRGDKIALVGSTGNSTGPHLHFEVRKNEVPVNPSNYLK